MANSTAEIAAAGGNLTTEVASTPISRKNDTISPGDSSNELQDKEVAASNIVGDKVAPVAQTNATVAENMTTGEMQQSGQSSITDESSKANATEKTLIPSKAPAEPQKGSPQNATGEEETPAKNEGIPDVGKKLGEPQNVTGEALNSSIIEKGKQKLPIADIEKNPEQPRNVSIRKAPELGLSPVVVVDHDAGIEKLQLDDKLTRFNTNSSPKVFDHVYLSMVNTVIVLWLILHIYPTGKRFFSWVQKRLTKSNKNSRRRKKQKK